MSILTVNLLFSTLVFWIAARIYVLPRLAQLRPQTVLLPILLLHSFRRLGLMFLAPGATDVGLPLQFARPAAFGDLLAALLAGVCARRGLCSNSGSADISAPANKSADFSSSLSLLTRSRDHLQAS